MSDISNNELTADEINMKNIIIDETKDKTNVVTTIDKREKEESQKERKLIEHIVLSGGAYLGLYHIGVLKYLNEQQYYDFSNIKSIHGTSIGALVGAVLSLQIDWNTLIEYFIKRPWYKIINITPTMVFDALQKKGIFGYEFFHMTLEPLLKTCDIPIDITLIDFYRHTGIEMNIYTVNYNTFELVTLNYKTEPELKLIQAIHMSCALPYLFQPVVYKDNYYIDGGLLNNYPVNKCFEHIDANIDNILSIKFIQKETEERINETMNIFEYGYILYKKLVKSIREKETNDIKHKNEIIIPCNEMNLTDANKVLNDEEERKQYIEQGEIYGKVFLSYKSNNMNV